MNRTIRITIFSALLPALILLLTTAGCKKDSDTTQDPSDSEFLLKGSVVNAKTHAGIAGATVYIGQTVLTTDAAGLYQVNCKPMGYGSYDVRVLAPGYGYGFASATIQKSAAMVNTVLLKPLETPVAVGSQGGMLTVTDPEGLTPGSLTTMDIPSGALSATVNVTMTRFTGIEVPGYAPAGKLNLCTVNLGPAGTVSAKEIDLHLALPFDMPAVDQLPVIRYDFTTNTWTNTGTLAQVDHSTGTASVKISTFGTYSLATAGSFTETDGTGGTPATLELSTTGSSIDLKYLAKNDYPGGTPPAISPVYLRNLASQNTTLHGCRVSFSDSTTFMFNYIGSKPDSIPGVKSTSGYYRWVPRVIHGTRDIPMTTTINDVSVSGVIQKELYSDASGWMYAHDQGGGGK